MIHRLLEARLEPLARQQRGLRLWSKLAACWGLAALAGFGIAGLQSAIGWSSSLSLPLVALGALAAAGIIIYRRPRGEPDWRALARELEAQYPELDGRLLTAVEQAPAEHGSYDYLQQRLLEETLSHEARVDWSLSYPGSRLVIAKLANALALVLLATVLSHLYIPGSQSLLVTRHERGVEVTPGDVSLERGSSLVVMARFGQGIPPRVDLVVAQPSDAATRIPLSKSLNDPLFGATVPEVHSNFVYYLEFAGERTRDYQVTVFEYPRLERADADVIYPGYSGQAPRHFENTRRVTAVEGSLLSLSLQLNKTVASAALIAKGSNAAAIRLTIERDRPLVSLTNFLLTATRTYDLQLIDLEGRTNKLSAQFVFDALKNRAPELKIASPRGDTRPSALEEISFEGTVWDDFGAPAFGLMYSLPGKDPQVIQLGGDVPAKEKRPFSFLLRLEDLGLQVGDLLSWFAWADDVGPDGKPRRTTTDLFFAEVRPFDEIFREGPSMSSGGESQQQEQAGGQAGRLAELQKQIISASWKVFRAQGAALPGMEPGFPSTVPGTNSAPLLREKDKRQTFIPLDSPAKPRVISRASFVAQRAPDAPDAPRRARPAVRETGRRNAPLTNGREDDLGVILGAQEEALEKAKAAKDRQDDPRTAALWEKAIEQMETALTRLRGATNSTAAFQEALAAEQAAYQALLKLQDREFSVSRSQSQQGQSGNRQQQRQRQLDQLDLKQSENRYETERQAQAPQNETRREQLQVMNRLEELARRQQDINEQLKELQTALQEARTEKEREEARRQLKRLQEEQQQMLADADEARQMMDRPENQSQMTEQRQQMEQARNELQRAADAAQQGQASQALASGTRAQRQLQQMREELRRQNASEFAEELKQMRGEARELARQQEEIRKEVSELNNSQRRSLSDAELNKETIDRLARQAERLTNLVQSATQLSQQAESSEPLMSRELYDSIRKFSQNDLSTVKQFQEELIKRGKVTRELYERLKQTAEQSSSKTLDLTGEMLRQGYLPEADLAEQRARAGIVDLKQGVERAAESVLGDDAESLRLAREELDRLTDQLQREIAQGESGGTNGPGSGPASNQAASRPDRPSGGENRQPGADDASDTSRQGQSETNRQAGNNPGPTGPRQEATLRPEASELANRNGEPQPGQGQSPGAREGTAPGELANNQQQAGAAPGESQPQRREGSLRERQGGRNSSASDPSRDRSGGGGGGGMELDRLLESRSGQTGGPLTGDDFAPWSDGLREVEELVDTPSLRNDVARAREQARQFRQDFKRGQKKPDWANVRLQVLKPLVEVSTRISEDLARREPREELVLIDRDPVPARYSDLVRRYYEQLGKDSGAQTNRVDAPRN